MKYRIYLLRLYCTQVSYDKTLRSMTKLSVTKKKNHHVNADVNFAQHEYKTFNYNYDYKLITNQL